MIWNKDTVYPKLFGEFSCIYALENRKNGKVYIGRAEKYTPRLSAHYYTLKKGTHSNVEMQRDFDEGHDFEIKILCTFQHDFDARREEMALETFFIVKYKAVEKGYNKSYNFNNKECAIKAILANAEYICRQMIFEDVVEINP